MKHILSAFLLLALVVPSYAVTIFSEDFTTGTLADAGFYNYNSSASGAAWSISSGEAVNSNSSAVNTYLIKSFGDVTLEDIGDELTLTWTYRNDEIDTKSGVMRVELFDFASPITSDNFGGANPFTGRQAIGLDQAHAALAFADPFLYNGSTRSFSPQQRVSAPNNSGGGGLITYELRILRSTPLGVNVFTTISGGGGTNVNNFFSPLSDFNFNGVSILGSWDGSDGFSRLGEVTLTSTVPEPSTYAAMIGLSALGLVIARRRMASKSR